MMTFGMRACCWFQDSGRRQIPVLAQRTRAPILILGANGGDIIGEIIAHWGR
jgi:hypothetical protein